MAKPTILKDRHTGEEMYPHTLASLVRTSDGGNAEDAIASKQDALTTSEDLQISDDNELSLTEIGKRSVFDDMYLTAAGSFGAIDYSHVEGGVQKPYKLNGLWLTYEEAVACYEQTANKRLFEAAYASAKCRTNMPPMYYVDSQSWTVNIKSIAMACLMEYVNLMPSVGNIVSLPIANMTYAFYNSDFIKCINGILDCTYATSNSLYTAFYGNKQLETLQLKNLKGNVRFNRCAKLSLDSLQYMVSNAANTAPITITLHADAYARVTEEIFAAATARQITIASA